MTGNTEKVSLRPVTKENLYDVFRLQVKEEQRRFVASNSASIAEVFFEERAWFRAIYAGETPVGFVMLYLDEVEKEYSLWRFMIAAEHQGKGYGRAAMRAIIEVVRALPGAEKLDVSYVPGDGGPSAFYQSLGFMETGEMDGDERVMRLALTTDD